MDISSPAKRNDKCVLCCSFASLEVGKKNNCLYATAKIRDLCELFSHEYKQVVIEVVREIRHSYILTSELQTSDLFLYPFSLEEYELLCLVNFEETGVHYLKI